MANHQDIEPSWYTDLTKPPQPLPAAIHNMTQRRYLEMEGACDVRYAHASMRPYGNANDAHDISTPATSRWSNQHYNALYNKNIQQTQYQQ